MEALSRGDLGSAPVSEPERALLELVRVVTCEAYKSTPAEIQAVRDAGYTDPEIAEAVYIAALFAFFNRVADAFGLQDPNYFARLAPPPGAADAAPAGLRRREG